MGGLRRLCKLYGRITIQGVKYVWDYAKDEPRVEKEMTKEEWVRSERVRFLQDVDGFKKIRKVD